jgi:dipeptidyl aminopeptidase/acylaminoacyl peptidase
MRRLVLPVVFSLVLSAVVLAQSRTVSIPANVTIDGVTPIPPTIAEAVAPYAQFRWARLVAWHPVERRMIISTRFGTAPQLHQVRFPGGARTQLTFYADGIAEPVAGVSMPKGDAFIFQKDTGSGAESNQLFRYDVATGSITLLTDGKSKNGVPAMSRSGLIAYESTRRNGKDRDLYVMDPVNPSSNRLLAQVEGSWAVLDWSADERTVLALEIISAASETYLWKVSVPGGEKTLLTPKDAGRARWASTSAGTAWSAGFAPDGTVYALSNFKGEYNRIWRFAEGHWTAVTPENQAIETFALSPDGRTIAAVFDLGSTTKLQLLDGNGRVKPTPSLPPGVVSDLRWHPAGTDVGFSLASSRAFYDVYSIAVARQRVDRWTSSEMGGVNAESLPDAEIVKWKSFDGLEISGVLYRAPAKFTGARPVIINVHGGPAGPPERPRQIGRSNYFRNELGITIIYPNIRGSLGFGRTFEALDNGRLRENAIKDIGALLDWIGAQPSLDKTRVLITGPSYGGYVSLAAAIEYPDRIRAVNPVFGITDYPTFLESTDMSRVANRITEYGDPSDPDMRAYLTRISPLANVARLRAPVYIVAGAKDTRVPISQAETMVKALKANGTPVWYVRLEDAGHLILTTTTNDLSFYIWVMFVQQYLLN